MTTPTVMVIQEWPKQSFQPRHTGLTNEKNSILHVSNSFHLLHRTIFTQLPYKKEVLSVLHFSDQSHPLFCVIETLLLPCYTLPFF